MKLNIAQVLSEKEILMINDASKEILENTGIKVFSKKVLDIYKKGGADVDYHNMVVKIPAKLVEKCVRSAPSEFRIYYSDREKSLEIRKNKSYCASGHNAIYMFDTETLERRPISKIEVGNFARISDYLENINVVGVQAIPQDVNTKASILHAVDAVFNNTNKPIFFSPENVTEAEALVEIVKTVSGDKYLGDEPIAICQLSPISPLKWSGGTSEALVEVAKSGLPLCFLPQPYSGVTSPITLAGTLTINNIEVLSGIVLAQIINEGCALFYGAAWTTFEMNKGIVLFGTPERCVLSVAGAQMADHYQIPSQCISFDTDSNIYDEQNGFEKIFNTIANLQSGINLLVNAGMFSTGFTVSYEQLIVDHEIASFVYRYLDGIEVSNDTIAKKIIQDVTLNNKNFLMEPHTMKYLYAKKEHVSYKVSNRDVYENWKTIGKPSITDNARKIADEIISSHRPPSLSDDKKDKIDKIIRDFESRYK